jgi:tetratricopeptide (TPR) repeat protein
MAHAGSITVIASKVKRMKATKFLIPLGLLIALLLLAGCSQSYLSQGRNALDDGHYDAAAQYLKQALQEDPNNPQVLKALGRLQYHQGEIAEAKKNLMMAQKTLPDDPQIDLYLGFCAESDGDYASAADSYQRFLAAKPNSRIAGNVRGRLLFVKNESLRKQVAQAVKTETSLSKKEPQPLTVAVLPFYVGDNASPQLHAIADGLAATLWYDLASIKQLTMVERLQVNYLMQELKIAKEGLTSKESAPQVGKIVSAGHLVNASLNETAENELSLDAALVTTTTSKYQPTFNANNQLKKVLQLEKDMTLAILDSLGIKLSDSERHKLEAMPTDSYDAFLAFSQGIQQYDQGNYSDANKFFDQARSIDPRFGLANQFAAESQLLMSNTMNLQQFDNMVLANVESTAQQTAANLTDAVRAVGAPETNPRVEDQPDQNRTTATVSGEVR